MTFSMELVMTFPVDAVRLPQTPARRAQEFGRMGIAKAPTGLYRLTAC